VDLGDDSSLVGPSGEAPVGSKLKNKVSQKLKQFAYTVYRF